MLILFIALYRPEYEIMLREQVCDHNYIFCPIYV